MIDLTQIITQVPINVYVVIGCCIVGWLMKKFLPTDNRIIPVTLTVIGAVVYVLLEGIGVENIIIGAFTGAASTGLHQIFAQYVEGTRDRDEDLIGAYVTDPAAPLHDELPDDYDMEDEDYEMEEEDDGR